MADPSDVVSTAIRATDLETLYELVRTHHLDFGCRAMARQFDQGQYETVAFLTHAELDALRNEDLPLEIEVLSDGLEEDRWAEQTVGQGDRFAGGSIPRGG